MAEQLWFTTLLNQLFASSVTPLLHAVGIKDLNSKTPIPNFVAMQVLVFLLLVVFFALVRTRLSVNRPGALQQTVECIHGFVGRQSQELIGDHSERFTSFLVTLGLFILASSLLGLVPGFGSPAAVPSVPLGCALVVFFYYQAQGFKQHGVAYLRQFAGPMPLLAPLMIPIEITSHVARVLSLTVRLFANIFAGEMVTLVFFSLVPIGVPVLFMGLHIGVSLLQTYIFVLLATLYLAGAVARGTLRGTQLSGLMQISVISP